MRERVRGYADGVLDALKPKDLRDVAGQLRSFSSVVASSDDLRSALSLPTTSPGVRRSIVADLLHKHASVPAVAVLAYAAQSGTGADFAEDAEQLAVIAEAKSEGKVALVTGPLGRKTAADRVWGFASAVLAGLDDQRKLGNVEDELFRFMRIVEGNDELKVALTTNELPVEVRRGLVEELLGHRATTETARMATYAASTGRPHDYPELLGALVDQVASEAQRRVADVRSAVEMTGQQRHRLGESLARLTGTPVDVRVTVEPDLLGGFVATVGDTVVDASLRHRLGQARDLLAAPPSLAPAPTLVHGPGQPAPGSQGN